MKKLITLFMLTVLLSTLLLTGCGDDSSSSTEPDPYNVDDFTYIFSVNNGFERDTYYVMISSYDGTSTISDASLIINGSEIILESAGFDGFYFYTAYVNYSQGDNLDCQLTINNNSYDVVLVIPSYPSVQWPAIYNPAEAVTIDWTMTANSEYQYFYGYAETIDWETLESIEDEKFIQLDSSARSYTIDANWLNPDLEYYDFYLEEYSFDTDDEVVAFAMASSSAYYGSEWRENSSVKVHQKIKKIIEELEFR